MRLTTASRGTGGETYVDARLVRALDDAIAREDAARLRLVVQLARLNEAVEQLRRLAQATDPEHEERDAPEDSGVFRMGRTRRE
jgi:hypothetical protein